VIAIQENHRLVQMTDEVDWTELMELVESTGRPPHLRALCGALAFRATRKMTIRETEDQIRHYPPPTRSRTSSSCSEGMASGG